MQANCSTALDTPCPCPKPELATLQESDPFVRTGTVLRIICGLSNIPSSRIGGLRRAFAELARACARAVWLKVVFGQSHHADTLRWLIVL